MRVSEGLRFVTVKIVKSYHVLPLSASLTRLGAPSRSTLRRGGPITNMSGLEKVGYIEGGELERRQLGAAGFQIVVNVENYQLASVTFVLGEGIG